jgi:hypothetical protein
MVQDLVVADVFCGVGAICLLLAKTFEQRFPAQTDATNDPPSLRIIANDWNEKAINYLTQSIESNKFHALHACSDSANGSVRSYNAARDDVEIENRDGKIHSTCFELHSQEAYEFLVQLGTSASSPSNRRPLKKKTNKEQQRQQQQKYPHHVLMNFPLEAPRFLTALRWWSSDRIQEQYDEDGMYPRFHVYTFARATRFTNQVEVIDMDDEEENAVDIVAESILPSGFFTYSYDNNEDKEDGYCGRGVSRDDADADDDEEKGFLVDEEDEAGIFSHRRAELDEYFGANVSTRLVRDVAPGKVVVCVSFSLTPKLVRYMQGRYW